MAEIIPGDTGLKKGFHNSIYFLKKLKSFQILDVIENDLRPEIQTSSAALLTTDAGKKCPQQNKHKIAHEPHQHDISDMETKYIIKAED